MLEACRIQFCNFAAARLASLASFFSIILFNGWLREAASSYPDKSLAHLNHSGMHVAGASKVCLCVCTGVCSLPKDGDRTLF